MKEKILNRIIDYYLSNKDYNGITISKLVKEFKDINSLKLALLYLTNEKLIYLYTCPVNHFTKNFDLNIPVKEQIKLISEIPAKYESKTIDFFDDVLSIYEDNMPNITFYPSNELIDKTISNDKTYWDLPPFKKMILKGMPQLNFLYFSINVLNRFLDDPRYTIVNYDYKGSISYFINNDSIDVKNDEDYLFLKYFGLAYNKETNENLITIFPSDLARLSNRLQNHFYSYLIEKQKDCLPEIAYYNNVMGEYSSGISIFRAIFEELNIINQMFNVLCNRNLFKNLFDFSETNRPDYFHPFLQPTTKMYSKFVETLSKICIDTLDKKSIMCLSNKLNIDISTFDEKKNLKGSLSLLQELLSKGFKSYDKKDMGIDVIIPLKKLYAKRSQSVHSFEESFYDKSIFNKYKATINITYKSIRNIRLILSNFREIQEKIKDKTIDISEDLYNGNVNTYFSPFDLS